MTVINANNKCADKFYCISGASNPTPNDGTTGRLCAVGHYCRNGIETKCDNGAYGKVTGLSACTVCPMGYYCPNHNGTKSVTQPIACENTKYCPQGSA
jgi:hypothetical protein